MRPGRGSGAHRIAVRTEALGADARALISAARGGDDPTARDRARVRRALLAALATTAVAGGATATASAAATGALGGGAGAGAVGASSLASAGGGAVGGSSVAAAGSVGTVGVAASGAALATGSAGTTLAAGGFGASLAAKVAALVIAVGAGGMIAVAAPHDEGDTARAETVSVAEAVALEAAALEAVAPEAAALEAAAPEAVAPVADSSEPVASGTPTETEEVAGLDVAGPIETASVETVPDVERVAEREVAIAAPMLPRARRARAAAVPSVAPAVLAAPTSPAPTWGLGDELPLVRAAWSALREGRVDAALASLEEHRARFPDGVLSPERDAARAVALCSAGRAEGPAAASSFLSAHPRSPYAARVRAACAR